MELMEGLQIIKEMCKAYGPNCTGCPLIDNCEEYCEDIPMHWTGEQIRDLVAAAEEWKGKHRPKTMKEVLKERMPDVEMNGVGLPLHCPHVYFGKRIKCLLGHQYEYSRLGGISEAHECHQCWNRPAPEMYQDKE